MTLKQLLAQLRQQMQAAGASSTAAAKAAGEANKTNTTAAKPFLAEIAKHNALGAKALAEAGKTADALEDAVTLMEQRYADRMCCRYGVMLRLVCPEPEEYYALERKARAAHPELWEGAFQGTGTAED